MDSRTFNLRSLRALFTTFITLILTTQPAHPAKAIPDLVEQSFPIGQYAFPVFLPRGFSVDILSTDLDRPRLLHFFGERLFIGSRSGKVYFLDPPYNDPQVLIELPDYPHSVVVNGGRIYIAQTGSISSAPYTNEISSLSEDALELLVALPGGRGHNSRTLKLGPDNKLYVSLGISGNCSDEYLDVSYAEELRRGGVFQIDRLSNPPRLIPFASGLRNPVGLDWHPVTGELYATNNGPDHRGYEYPRESFARLKPGSFHGMPWFQYENQAFVRDACIKTDPPRPVKDVSRPVATFPARIAPMDMVFLNDEAIAQQYENDALVALHGSWATSDGGGGGDPASRREPRIVRVDFKNGRAGDVLDFMTGFQLPNGTRWARPVGISMGPDGHIYFTSDDGIQGLYRIRFNP